MVMWLWLGDFRPWSVFFSFYSGCGCSLSKSSCPEVFSSITKPCLSEWHVTRLLCIWESDWRSLAWVWHQRDVLDVFSWLWKFLLTFPAVSHSERFRQEPFIRTGAQAPHQKVNTYLNIYSFVILFWVYGYKLSLSALQRVLLHTAKKKKKILCIHTYIHVCVCVCIKNGQK